MFISSADHQIQGTLWVSVIIITRSKVVLPLSRMLLPNDLNGRSFFRVTDVLEHDDEHIISIMGS